MIRWGPALTSASCKWYACMCLWVAICQMQSFSPLCFIRDGTLCLQAGGLDRLLSTMSSGHLQLHAAAAAAAGDQARAVQACARLALSKQAHRDGVTEEVSSSCWRKESGFVQAL